MLKIYAPNKETDSKCVFVNLHKNIRSSLDYDYSTFNRINCAFQCMLVQCHRTMVKLTKRKR